MTEAVAHTRLEEILTVMCELARGELGARVRPLPKARPTALSTTLDGIGTALNMLGEELEAAVTRRKQHELAVRKLEQAQLQLLHSAKLASLGELAAGVAHELNQPLQIIELAVDEVRDALDARDREGAASYLQTIEDQVARSAGVIGRLMAFSRRDHDAVRPRTRVNEIIAEAVGIWGTQLTALGIELSTELATDLDEVVCQSHELLQVITNLVINARDAVMDRPRRLISLRTMAEDTSACVEITDTGSGIDPSHLPRVFDPFFTTKPPGQGTGLGLSVSHGIIRRHGGTIEAFSELGRGTRMRVTLPIASPP